MNNFQVFLKTRIKNLGFWSGLGNFFLAPARYFFSGKTVIIERDKSSNLPKKDGTIAKVSSFALAASRVQVNVGYQDKISKQDPNLKSTLWGYNLDFLVIPFIQLALLVPFTILGSIFKGFSYLSPVVREAHNTVKNKLTAQDKIFGSSDEPVANNQRLDDLLTNYLETGQKTKALVIYAQNKILTAKTLTRIKDINPLKLILVGNWKKDNSLDVRNVITSRQNRHKWKNWDVSALEFPFSPEPVNKFDYSVPKSKVVGSIDLARNAPRPSFFSPKHTVYVVLDQNQQALSFHRTAT